MKVSLGSYTHRNTPATTVSIDGAHLFFSYKTVVAFETPKTGFVISENVWGPTTGRHLNELDDDKSKRLDRTEFERQLEALNIEIV